jgi:hypothetical protein
MKGSRRVGLSPSVISVLYCGCSLFVVCDTSTARGFSAFGALPDDCPLLVRGRDVRGVETVGIRVLMHPNAPQVFLAQPLPRDTWTISVVEQDQLMRKSIVQYPQLKELVYGKEEYYVKLKAATEGVCV